MSFLFLLFCIPFMVLLFFLLMFLWLPLRLLAGPLLILGIFLLLRRSAHKQRPEPWQRYGRSDYRQQRQQNQQRPRKKARDVNVQDEDDWSDF